MRYIFIIGIGFLLAQMPLIAQSEPTPKSLEDFQQEMYKQMQELQSIFGEGNMLFDTSIFRSFNFEHLDQLPGFGDGMTPDELREQLRGNDFFMMPEHFDAEEMMKMLEKSMGGMNQDELENLLGPFFQDLAPLMPKEDEILKGEDGKPIKRKKTYKL